MKETGKINYVEIPSRDLEATKAFFASAFGWSFVDYGSEYVAIENAGLDGGFYKSDKVSSPESGSVLVVLYSSDLEATVKKEQPVRYRFPARILCQTTIGRAHV